jgi:AcrR family transcriptional regulator
VSGAGAPSPARQRRDRERARARETILAAARELARAEGWEAVTMRRLADRIEYSANFAYRYFAGRDDILLALVRDGFARLRAAMADAAGAPGPEPAAVRAAVHRAARAYLRFALDEPEVYRLMYGLGGVHVAAAEAWREGQAVGDVLGGLLAAAGVADPDAAVLRMWGLAHGLVALRAVGRLVVDAGRLAGLLDTAVDDVLDRVLPAQVEGEGEGEVGGGGAGRYPG